MAVGDTWTLTSYFTLWTLLLATVSCQWLSRPKLEPDTSSMNIQNGLTLSITCRGPYNLQWSTQNTNTKIQTTPKEEVDEDKKITYISQLKVENIQYSDTGYYTCSYIGTKRDSYDNSTRIYVFVNDPDNLFVNNPEQFIQITPGTEAIIPCRPTDPQINMTLIKGLKLIDIESGDIKFDNRIGYIILYPNIFYSDSFICKAQLKEKTSEVETYLFWSSVPDYIPVPYIDISSATYVVTGGEFSLTCIIGIDNSNNKFKINWNYRKKDLPENTNIVEGKTTTIPKATQNNQEFYELVKTLNVTNVDSSDDAVYTCEVTDSVTGKSKTSETYIHVHSPNSTTLMFRSDMDETKPNHIPLVNGKVQIVVYIRAHPKPTEIRWLRNFEKELKNNSKYQIEKNNNLSSLLIKPLNINDTGNYTLSVATPKQRRNITFNIWITSKPKVIILHDKPFKYLPFNESSEIDCKGEALPEAKVKWEWSPCGNFNCAEEYRDLQGYNEETEKMSRFGTCNFVRTLTLNAKIPAFYRCTAKNDLGTAQKEILLITTDIKDDSFGFSIENATDLSFYETDSLKLLCKASKFNYTSNLIWKRASGEIIQNDPGHSITKNETLHSYELQLKIPNLQIGHSGDYICETKNLQFSTNTQRRVNIEVYKIRSPYSLGTNMNGSVYSIQNEDAVEFICNVTGIPEPKIKWLRDNETLDEKFNNQYIFTKGNKILRIPRVVKEDEGIYFCLSNNRGGSLSLNATLQVIEIISKAKLSSGVKIAISVVIVVIVLALIILSAIVARKCYLDRKERMEIYQLERALFEKGAMERYNPDLPFEEQIEFLPYDQQWEFPREKLKLGKTIGQGAFGRVVKGEAQGIVEGEESTTVAVKMLKENANIEQRKALMQELKIMIHLGRHVNILNLLGACVQNAKKGELLAIMEFCRYGNLRNFLLRHRQSFVNQINPETGEIDKTIVGHRMSSVPMSPTRTTSGVSTTTGTDGYLIPNSPGINSNSGASFIPSELIHSSNSADSSGFAEDSNGFGFGRLSISTKPSASTLPLNTSDLVCFSYQIACGMEYLASKKLVHRDLAARNILLADNHIIKICDFGLAKDCYKKAYYRKKGNGPLPVKWMAIESIKDRVFSVESDIWSYGIVLWELFSLGSNPYPGFEVDENFYKKLLSGYRMEKPDYATDDIYNIMMNCWDKEPQNRPQFSELVEQVGSYLDSGTRQHYLELNDHYLQLCKLSSATTPDYVNMRNDSNNDFQENYANLSPTSDSLKGCDSGYINSSALEEDFDPNYLQMRASIPNIRYNTKDGNSCELVSMLPRTSAEAINDAVVQSNQKTSSLEV